ncbi:superoxide dismutase [Fe], chloroplastic isoform X1 [Phoenix dactylifera]|uniref:superoxide dismutase n=1 Tax=Phoenix dactylifera TaxID=42345 RepID=A0A8B7CT70_PHODC|nr:superoxide dismutase [Fe], chloroplastic isoform X1 [Phoenix dactylifera]
MGGASLLSALACGVSSSSIGAPPHSFLCPTPNRRRKSRRKVRCAPITAQFELKPPPYPLDSLEPHMSRETLEHHWGRHHRGHVDSLNARIAGTQLEEMELEDVVVASYNKGSPLPPFVHAAQVWNHDFFWRSMEPGGGGKPSGELMGLIERDFGSFERMLKEFKEAASTQFGSGWAWLAYKANRLDVGNAVNPCPSEKDNKLVIAKTPNAVNPLVWDYSPLLAVDVWEVCDFSFLFFLSFFVFFFLKLYSGWQRACTDLPLMFRCKFVLFVQHAYYLDYENRRADYVSIFMEKLVSWDIVSSRLHIATARAAERAREDERRRREDDVEITNREAVEMYVDSDNDSEPE